MADKLHFVSLGCPKNLVDSEVMMGALLDRHYSPVDEPEEADVIVVNTCSFIGPATKESVETILEMAEWKKKGKCSTLVVTGCLAQRYAAELEEEIPEVDYFFGTGEYHRLADVLEKRPATRTYVGLPTWIHDESSPKVLSRSRRSAWLKIAEGCRHRCSFCIIPTLRGDLRSRSIESIVAEARRYAEQGVVELNLISQDNNSYGYDRVGGRGRRTELGRLLRALGRVDVIRWIRLMYMYPLGFPRELMDVIAEEPKVVNYIDMPLQHISHSILRAMHRGVGGEKCRNLVRTLRERIPNLTLRTTFIVGFPGETDEDFQALVDFVEEIRFERMGVFTFSPEPGTPAAQLDDNIPARVKEERRRILMKVQKKIARAHSRSLVGQVHDVLIEGVSEESDLLLQGRLASQAPEVDGHVLITSGYAHIGEIVPTRIERAMDYDVIGQVVETEERPLEPRILSV